MASVHNVEETLKDIVTVNEETNGGVVIKQSL
jgi:hypothetical protein